MSNSVTSRLMFLLSFFLLLSLLKISMLQAAPHVPTIKVKFNLKSSVITMISNSSVILDRKKSQKINTYKAKTKIKINCKKFEKNLSKPDLFVSVSARNKILNINGESYKGKIQIFKDHKNQKCFVVGQMDLEDYVQSILPTEMSASWPVEALKAQAIAARTYALYRILTMNEKQSSHNITYHLENSEKDQVNGSLNDWTKKTQEATIKTKGMVLVNEKKELVPAFFHAKCGGSTLTPGQVWENSFSSYQRVKDPYCVKSGKPYWYHQLTGDGFRKFLRWQLKKQSIDLKKKIATVKLSTDSVYNAYLKFVDNDKSYLIPKSSLRKYFGRYKIQSNHFKILRNKVGDYIFYGRGRGHGVGMCQIGAHVMSKRGKGFKNIINYYYPKLSIVSYLK